MSLILRSASVSDPGLVRSNNEDVAYAGRRLIAVADGMGGLPAGEVASEIVLRRLCVSEQGPIGPEPCAALSAAIEDASGQIRAATEADPASEGMGTTATAALLTGDRLAVVHVGDSRGYLLRRAGAESVGSVATLHQLTRDDTFVQWLVDQGVLTPDDARRHPQRSLVTNAVQGVPVEPATALLAVGAGDRLLLCTDGLSDVVTDEAIGQALVTYADVQQCAEQLVKLAHQAGAPDNVTVVVADVVPLG